VGATVTPVKNDRAEVVLGGGDLDSTLAFFESLGFVMTMITPADAPSVAVVEGHGLTLRLDTGAEPNPVTIRVAVDEVPEPSTLTAPNGTIVELVEAAGPLDIGRLVPSFVVSRPEDGAWHRGRAGMRYRDLIPDRQGGRFIASHISIPDGGPVPDYVHHHHIRFQLIFCYRGWARLVYEDQGPPFLFEAGDCVLQPPHIRHRVLENSDAFQVVEVGCPAVHQTFRDHELALPTTELRPDRDYGGQRFVVHRGAEAAWEPWRFEGFEQRDFGFGAATGGIGGARVVRHSGPAGVVEQTHDAELVFWFVTEGTATLERTADDASTETNQLNPATALVLPAGSSHRLAQCSDDFELLEVTLPASL
jgi:mannose-6-phosphate isomerase-like protein (cupin superfamily)